MLIRRESARKNETPAFGIRCEVGPLQHGLWWQREEFARSAFAAANWRAPAPTPLRESAAFTTAFHGLGWKQPVMLRKAARIHSKLSGPTFSGQGTGDGPITSMTLITVRRAGCDRTLQPLGCVQPW